MRYDDGFLSGVKRTQAGFVGKVMLLLLLVVAVAIGALIGVYQYQKYTQSPSITTQSVITQVEQLVRLQTVAFSVDTIVTAEKQGSWQMLWQDQQKGLFIIKGRVLAGVDLSMLDEKAVHLDTQNDKMQLQITLPKSQIFAVYLDEISVYDWQTGLFGTMANDPSLLKQVQADAKQEVLKKACAGGVLAMAADNASTQVAKLFSLADVEVSVEHLGSEACQLPEN